LNRTLPKPNAAFNSIYCFLPNPIDASVTLLTAVSTPLLLRQDARHAAGLPRDGTDVVFMLVLFSCAHSWAAGGGAVMACLPLTSADASSQRAARGMMSFVPPYALAVSGL